MVGYKLCQSMIGIGSVSAYLIRFDKIMTGGGS